ncbi:MAG: PIG-L family deacetylase [Bacteroidota bacterium]
MITNHKTLQNAPHEGLLYPSAQVYDWGSTLVVSPHPNAEVLGCGGAMALLRQVGFRVHILFMSDGETLASSKDKPNESEPDVYQRVEQVGVSDDAILFLHLRDDLIPLRGKPGFDEAVRLFLNELESFQPDTILLPFLDQGSQDVQATWQIARQAASQSYYPIRMVEYGLWSWYSAGISEGLASKHSKTWRLDIKEVIDQKSRALEGYRQSKFQLPWQNPQQELLVHQTNPWEVYLEYTSNEAP